MQLTFTEDEAKKHAEFINFVFKRATWNNMTTAEALEVQRHFLFMQMFQKKVDEHIMELKEVIEKPAPKTKGKK